MTWRSPGTSLRVLHPIVRNLLALTGWWSAVFVLVRIARHVSGESAGLPLAFLSADVIGVLIALWLSARWTAFFLAGQVTFGAVELAVHAYFGLASVQGGPTHFAVMGAGTLGVIFGALLRGATPITHEPRLGDPHTWFGTLSRAAATFRQRASLAAYTMAGLAAFVSAEGVIHGVFGLHPFRNTLTHFAIISAAALGVALGALIAMSNGSVTLRKRLPA